MSFLKNECMLVCNINYNVCIRVVKLTLGQIPNIRLFLKAYLYKYQYHITLPITSQIL